MERDWKRLGGAIRSERYRLGLSQDALAQIAGISRRSVMSLELGRESQRMPPSLAKVAYALGWPSERPEQILLGQDVPPAAPEDGQGLVAYRSAEPSHLAPGLPLRVIQELSSGEVVDTDVVDLGFDSGARMVLVLKRDYDAPTDAAALHSDLHAWSQVQDEVRRIVAAHSGSKRS